MAAGCQPQLESERDMNTDLLPMNLEMNSNAPVKARGFRHTFTIQEFECGLLYRHGKFQARLEAGRHVRWGFGYDPDTSGAPRFTGIPALAEVGAQGAELRVKSGNCKGVVSS